MRGSWRPNRNWNIFTLTLMAVTLCLSCSPDAQPEVQRPTLLGDSFLYCILSATSLVPKLHRGSRGPPRPGVAFPIISRTLRLELELAWLLSYITVQHPLDLWNRIFNRHQAEITVMQFRGHSLSVRQSMRVSWDFLACPIFLANFRPRDFLS